MPRGAAPPPQFDGRGAQQVLDAAADRAASLCGHRAVSCPANCLSQRLDSGSLSATAAAAAAVMPSASRAAPGRRVQLAWLWVWFWTDQGQRLRFRRCSASYFSAAAKNRETQQIRHEPNRTDPDVPPASRPHAASHRDFLSDFSQ